MRTNPTQLTLDRANAETAYEAHVAAIRVREGVRPLERRRLHRVAALIGLTPLCRRDRP